MNTRRFSHGLICALATAFFAACGGEQPQPESPPPPTPAAPEPPASPAANPSGDPAAMAPSTPSEPPKKVEAPKPNKEKIIGKWSQDFSGDVKTAAEDDAKKKAGKDEKKLADLLKKAEDGTTKHWMENTADTHTEYDGDKVVHKGKYEVVKDEGTTLVVKAVGKDEITKKEMPGEMTLTFVDDNTIQMKEPGAKDPAKAKTFVYKRK